MSDITDSVILGAIGLAIGLRFSFVEMKDVLKSVSDARGRRDACGSCRTTPRARSDLEAWYRRRSTRPG